MELEKLKGIKVFQKLSVFGIKDKPIFEQFFTDKPEKLDEIFDKETIKKIQKINKSCVVAGYLNDGTRCYIEVNYEDSQS